MIGLGQRGIDRVIAYCRARGLWLLWLDGIWQLSLILFLDQLYEIGRGLIPLRPHEAQQDAQQIMALEREYHLFQEEKLQRFWITHTHHVAGFQITPKMAIDFFNSFYLYAHFLGTAIFLVWFYFFRRKHFSFLRDVMFLSTGIAMITFIVYPTAPPRMFHGFIDILAPLIEPKLQQLQLGYNPYAAMPSLHFIWALIVGGGLIIYGRRRWLQGLGVVYITLMLATIIISANHFILDCIGSTLVVSASAAVISLVYGARSGRLQAWLSRVIWQPSDGFSSSAL